MALICINVCHPCSRKKSHKNPINLTLQKFKIEQYFQVTTAVKFLSNPNVQRCTLESKERFLRNKGLTEREIQKAVEKCGELLDVPSIASDFMFLTSSRKSWLRECILPIIVYGGFMYGCYWFYKVSRLILLQTFIQQMN